MRKLIKILQVLLHVLNALIYQLYKRIDMVWHTLDRK